MSLQDLANWAEIFGATTIIGGVIFALIQLREFRRQRREAIAVELMRSFYNPEFARAVYLIRQLPDGVSGAEIKEKGPEYEQAAILVTTNYETMGLLVFRRIAPFSMVRDLTGGIAVVVWKRLSRWTEEVREEQSQPSWGEWFQWLAERLMDAGKRNEIPPAHVQHANWRPRF